MKSLDSQPERLRLALAEYRRLLERRFGKALVEVRLFGSRARGEAHAESDVDLLVVLETAGWDERRDAIDLATDVGLERTLLLSPTVFDRATWALWVEQGRPLAREIERDGVPV